MVARASPLLSRPRATEGAHGPDLLHLTTPGNGLHEAIVDLVLWRARQHAQGQHVWIPPIEWGQALTHDTDTDVTRRGTIRLRRAPAKIDHRADPNHPEQCEQATVPTRNTALRAAGLCTPDGDLPAPPTDSDHPPPEVGVTVLERGHYYLVSATARSPGPQWLVKGTDTMLAPRGHPTRGSRGPHHPAQSPQGRPPAREQIPGPPGTGHALPGSMDPAPLAMAGTFAGRSAEW